MRKPLINDFGKVLMSYRRSLQQIRDHYTIEKELAARLLASNKEERKKLYTELYDELFKRVPDHPQIQKRHSADLTKKRIAEQFSFISRFLGPDKTFLELGPGDCALSAKVAKYVRFLYAVDVSNEITNGELFPENAKLIISDGTSVPVPEGEIDIAYSNQLMEHLHPEDAEEQLKSIYKALKQNGIYICVTPNGINGPHDISDGFDEKSSGFHLKEYTIGELCALLKKVGFSDIRCYVGKGRALRVPTTFLRVVETSLAKMPYRFRKQLGRFLPIRLLLGRPIVSIK